MPGARHLAPSWCNGDHTINGPAVRVNGERPHLSPCRHHRTSKTEKGPKHNQRFGPFGLYGQAASAPWMAETCQPAPGRRTNVQISTESDALSGSPLTTAPVVRSRITSIAS